MSKYQWLTFLHVSGAFLLIGGAVAAGVFNVVAQRRERPSEIALFLRLTRIPVVCVNVGMLVTIAFGLWLVHAAGQGYSFGDAWIVAALVLWAAVGALGGIGGNREKETRLLAERLATEGDEPSRELRRRMRDPLTIALSWSSGALTLAILGLMIWKPGA